jgi:integrase
MRRSKLPDPTMEQVLEAKPGRYYYRDGLVLVVTPQSARGMPNRRWIWRYKSPRTGRPTETTLCSALALPAEEARRFIRLGADPVADRRKWRVLHKTFAEVVNNWITDQNLTGGRLTLANLYLCKHAAELLDKPIRSITAERIQKVLKPLWDQYPTTARRTLNMLETVFEYATAKIWFSQPNPACWKGLHEHLWARGRGGDKPHHPGMAYEDIPRFMRELRTRQTYDPAAVALELTTLLAARSQEVLAMRWSEIHWDQQRWDLPPNRTKQRRQHRVPLSARAIELLRQQEQDWTGGERVFDLSPKAMRTVLKHMRYKGLTVHGFRSTFRSWAFEQTEYTWDVIELCLGHQIGDATARAYLRGDALDRRRLLMDQWSTYCGSTGKPALALVAG